MSATKPRIRESLFDSNFNTSYLSNEGNIDPAVHRFQFIGGSFLGKVSGKELQN